MSNRVRPKCPSCGKAMQPLFVRRIRGGGLLRLRDTFACRTHATLARGRRKVRYFDA